MQRLQPSHHSAGVIAQKRGLYPVSLQCGLRYLRLGLAAEGSDYKMRLGWHSTCLAWVIHRMKNSARSLQNMAIASFALGVLSSVTDCCRTDKPVDVSQDSILVRDADTAQKAT